ncbi:MAG TPA: thioesterase family protein [Vicinamibacterales bacterium]
MTEPVSRSPIRVRYAETDQMGVVYYANYFVWFEIGRTDLLRTLGGSYKELEEGGLLLPVIEASCEYAQPCRYDDELVIETRGRILSPIRVEFLYVVTRPADGVVTATGRTVHAAINRTGRPSRLPEAVRQALPPATTGRTTAAAIS